MSWKTDLKLADLVDFQILPTLIVIFHPIRVRIEPLEVR